jgi:hypothetical protein
VVVFVGVPKHQTSKPGPVHLHSRLLSMPLRERVLDALKMFRRCRRSRSHVLLSRGHAARPPPQLAAPPKDLPLPTTTTTHMTATFNIQSRDRAAWATASTEQKGIAARRLGWIGGLLSCSSPPTSPNHITPPTSPNHIKQNSKNEKGAGESGLLKIVPWGQCICEAQASRAEQWALAALIMVLLTPFSNRQRP